MHIDDFDDFSGSLVNLTLATIFILFLFLLVSSCGLGCLIPIISDLVLKRFVSFEWICDQLTLPFALFLIMIDNWSALATTDFFRAYKNLINTSYKKPL